MVLYFSGTGNSQFTAELIADIIQDELISINSYVKNRKKAKFHSDKPLVFVVPTYAWRVPKLVEQWILKNDFTGSRDTYFVLTCGDGCGNAAAYAKKLCLKKDFRFCGLTSVLMPENYLAMFPTPEKSECQVIMEAARPQIVSIAEQIQSGKCLKEPKLSVTDRVQSGPVNGLFYAFAVKDKGFHVSDQCISCGKCARRCVLNNIDMESGKPVWKGNCTHCMACIAGCPTEAIEYKDKSKGQYRHYIMKDNVGGTE